MRVIIKNADFQISGMKDISKLLNEVQTNFGGVGDNIGIVENLFRALGAGGNNGIWAKIKNLYMPVLSIPSDGINALYDIIAKTDYPGSNYTIETKRGVSPTTLGGTIGSKVSSAEITTSGASFFCVVTQSSRQTLGSSSGVFSQAYGITINWEKNDFRVSGASSTSLTVSHSDQFTKPCYLAVSADTNGVRHCVTRGGYLDGALTAGSAYDMLSGSSSWASTAVFACCEGLTPGECDIIASALDTFITDFGVLCVN